MNAFRKLPPGVNMNTILEQINQCPVYGAGTRAFYDAYSGLVPCTVLRVLEEGNGVLVGTGKLKIRCDANVGPYRKGETLIVSAHYTYPRTHRILRDGQYRINTLYRWGKSS